MIYLIAKAVKSPTCMRQIVEAVVEAMDYAPLKLKKLLFVIKVAKVALSNPHEAQHSAQFLTFLLYYLESY